MKIFYQSFTNRTESAPYYRHLEAYLQKVKRADTELVLQDLEPHDDYAHAAMEYRCGYQAMQNARAAEAAGFDAVVFGHFQDSGLAEAKALVDIPVLGLGEISMLTACQLAQKIALITLNPRFIPFHHDQIRRYGLENRVIGVGALDFQPGDFTAGFDEPERIRAAIDALRAQAKPLIAAGAELIIPAGGIPMLACSEVGGVEVDGVPVLNGLPVLLKSAEMAVELTQLGSYPVSRAGRFFKPPAEVIDSILSLS